MSPKLAHGSYEKVTPLHRKQKQKDLSVNNAKHFW